MRNINIKGILINTDKTFHLHMSLSIRSNGENVDIYLHLFITSTRSKCLWTRSPFLLEERNNSFSLWKWELPIRMITSITFPLLNKKPFSFGRWKNRWKKPFSFGHWILWRWNVLSIYLLYWCFSLIIIVRNDH